MLLKAFLLLAILGGLLALLYLARQGEKVFNSTRGWVVVTVLLVLMPWPVVLGGIAHNMRGAQDREFCLSCHEMEPYGRSLWVDDEELVPAHHVQDRLIKRDTACYDCHADYALFGDITTKLNGMKHVWVHYLGDVPEKIELYKPYPNDNCLSCHRGARSFLESKSHATAEAPMAHILSGEKSCKSSGCHDVMHAVDEVAEASLWKGAQ